MKTASELITNISGSIAIISILVMSFYLVNRRIYTFWQLGWKLLWLEIIFRYRDHTRKSVGHVGSWYHIFLVSVFIFLISINTELVIQLLTAPWPIIFVVAFSALLLLPLIGYAIYNMSKEKYYWFNQSHRDAVENRAPQPLVHLIYNHMRTTSSSKVVVKFLKTTHLLKSCGCGELHLRDPFT